MRKYRIIILIICILFSMIFISCGSSINKNEGSLSRQMKIYNNKLFSFDGFTVVYRNLNDSLSTVLPLCSDSLCSHDNSSCPLFLGMQVYLMVIDEAETKNNDNYPVLYISSLWGEVNDKIGGWDIDGYRIIRYNSKTNTSKTIISKIANPINSFYVYDEFIYYTTNDGDNGYNIYAVKKDGSNKFSLNNPEQNSYTLVGAYDNRVYYTDMLGIVYFSDLKLKEKTFLIQTQSIYGSCYIYDGYLYYADNCSIIDIMGSTDVENCNIYRILLNNDVTQTSSELIIENVTYAGMPYMFKGGNKIYYCIPDYRYVGLGFYYDRNNEKQSCDIYYDGTGSIYSYNLDNGEKRCEIESNDYKFSVFYGGSKDYIIYSACKVNEDLNQPYAPVGELFCYNIRACSHRRFNKVWI